MGIFDFFKKKKRKKFKIEQPNANSIVPVKTSQLTDPISYFSVHSDIKDLIWIENGPKRNYFPDQANEEYYQFAGITITISLSISGSDEPSLIDLNKEIKKPKNPEKVPSPPYFPNYKDLNSEQKYQYWQFLSNPYQSEANISYVFILYYGLERHLFMDNFQEAIKVIIKLRNVHKNSSFQSYSGNAIVLSCLLHQRADWMQVFIESLDEAFKRGFSDNLYLLSMHSFDYPLQAEDISRLAKTFRFTNTNYLKGYPELFIQTMEGLIKEKFATGTIMLKEIVPNVASLSKKEVRLFANISLSDQAINVPDIVSDQKLQQVMHRLLVDTHESVKLQLAEMRKNNVVPTKRETKRPKQRLTFDAKEEGRLLDELKKQKQDPVAKHFTYIQLQDFYYKYRDLAPMYLKECIRYCKEDLDMLDKLNKVYVQQEINRYEQLQHLYSKKENEHALRRIKTEKFQGNIPAFRRLAIIYEKRKEFDAAIHISKQAIAYYHNKGMDTTDFEKRIERLEKRIKD